MVLKVWFYDINLDSLSWIRGEICVYVIVLENGFEEVLKCYSILYKELNKNNNNKFIFIW